MVKKNQKLVFRQNLAEQSLQNRPGVRLAGDFLVQQMVVDGFVVFRDDVLDHRQNPDGRVGEELVPVQAVVSEEGDADLEAEQVVVLEDFHEREDQHGQVF